MKEILLASCIGLGAIATYSTVSAVKYKYPVTELPNNEFSPRENKKEEEPEVRPLAPEVIYDKNAFDAKRGVIDEEDGEAIEEDVVVKGSYTFELRGILGAGPKQVALFSAKPNSRSSSSKGRTVSRSTTTSSSNKIHICRIGASIAESDFKLTSIENGEVKIEDSKGNEQTFDFSLTSDESLQRSEVSFKNEASRQKSFAKQNTFKQPVKSQAPKTPTKITPEQAAKKRELEMRQRAEKLKQEMKRLKDMRDSSTKSTSDKKSKKSK